MKTLQCGFANSGFSLVEMALALGICAFSLIPLMGIIPVGIASNKTSIELAAGAELAASIVADLKTTRVSAGATDGTSPRLSIVIPGAPNTTRQSHTLFFDQNGESTGSVDSDADPAKNPRYRATLEFTTPPGATGTPLGVQRTATIVRVFITWPAIADRNAASPPKNYSGAYETVISLDRG